MKKIENFLPAKIFDKLCKEIDSINLDNLENIFDTNYEKKSTELLECIPLRIHTESVIQYKAYFLCKSILDQFRVEIKKNIKILDTDRIRFQVTIWNQGSFLNKHYDTHYKCGGTLYLNSWEESWGGLLQYSIGDDFLNICPEKNLFVFNNCNLEHQVTVIDKDCPQKRKTIQVWVIS